MKIVAYELGSWYACEHDGRSYIDVLIPMGITDGVIFFELDSDELARCTESDGEGYKALVEKVRVRGGVNFRSREITNGALLKLASDAYIKVRDRQAIKKAPP